MPCGGGGIPGIPPPWPGGPPPTPAFASLIRARSAEEGFRAVRRSPRPSTVRCTFSSLPLRESAAFSSMSFDLMNSSTSALAGAAVPRSSDLRASRMRASNAAEAFRAVLSDPRARTFRCTSGGQSCRSAAALSSISLLSMKSSISRRVGSAMASPTTPALMA